MLVLCRYKEETVTACISHKTAVVFLFQFAKVLCQLVNY